MSTSRLISARKGTACARAQSNGAGHEAPVIRDNKLLKRRLADLFHDPSKIKLNDPHLLGFLHEASTSTTYMELTRSLRGQPAHNAMTVIQRWLNFAIDHPLRPKAIFVLVKLASAQGADMPPWLYLRGVKISRKDPVGQGAFADVYIGTYKGQSVAVKQLRVTMENQARLDLLRKQFCREAFVWLQLKHPNILRLIGVDVVTLPGGSMPCLVAPWMSNGTLASYLKRVGSNNPLREQLLVDCASGILYLHTQGIIHGDIRATNVLVGDDGHALLSDFGLTGITDLAGSDLVTNTQESGGKKYMAPELHDPERFGVPHFRRTAASDIYSYGSLCLEVFSGKAQFPDLTRDSTVITYIIAGKRTRRPTASECGGLEMPEIWWELALRCLQNRSRDRPTASYIIDVMRVREVRAPGDQGPRSNSYLFRVTALHAYTGSLRRGELSFNSKETLDVLTVYPTQYQARKTDGSVGKVMSAYFSEPAEFRATAMHPYTALDQIELSVKRGDVLAVLRADSVWWTVRESSGAVGVIPATYVRPSTKECRRSVKALHTYTAPEGYNRTSFRKHDIFYVQDLSSEWVLARKSGKDTAGLVPPCYFELV